MTGLFELGIGLMLFAVLLGLGAQAFWLWMLIEAAVKEPPEGNDKVVWVLVVVLLNVVGAIVYFLFRRPQRIAQHGS